MGSIKSVKKSADGNSLQITLADGEIYIFDGRYPEEELSPVDPAVAVQTTWKEV